MANTADNLLVQKSSPLQSLSQTNLSLSEFKILDTYLAKINSHDPSNRSVQFEKGALEKILGIDRIRKEELKKRLRHLFQVVSIEDLSKPNGFKLVSLFEQADAVQDETGMWKILLTASPSAMEYIFNIDNIGYLRYKLKNVVNFTSRYSYIMFLYILDNRFRKEWTISISELKKVLRCVSKYYDDFKVFNSKILKPSLNEIIQKTDIQFKYCPVRKGKTTDSIRFTYLSGADIREEIDDSPVPNLLEDQYDDLFESDTENCFDEPDEDEIRLKEYGNENMVILAGACDYSFTGSQMKYIASLLGHIDIPRDAVTDSLLWGKEKWLRERYSKMMAEIDNKYQSGSGSIANRFKYLVAMIKKEADF